MSHRSASTSKTGSLEPEITERTELSTAPFSSPQPVLPGSRVHGYFLRYFFGGLFLLGLAIVFRLGLLAFAIYVLLGVMVVSRMLSRRWIDNVSVQRHCPVRSAEIGDRIELSLWVRNERATALPWLLVEETLPREALVENPPRLRIEGETLRAVRLAGNEQIVLSYKVEMLRRGFHQFGPAVLETGDLFGLHRRFRITAPPDYVLVRPKPVPLEGYDLVTRRPIGEVRMTHRLFEDPTRISGVRPYEHGDPLNRIHWRATARTGVLHSKVFEPSSVAGATLVLDFHRESFAGGSGSYRAELAVTSVASLANAVCQLGRQVGLVTNGRDAADRIRLEGWTGEFRTRRAAHGRSEERLPNERLRPLVIETRRGADQLDRILDLLARLEWTDGFNFAELLSECENRLPRDATVVAVLTDVSEQTAIALGNLRRSGYAVTAILVMFEESEFHRWAQPPEWAARLLAEGIEFRRVADEASLSALCGGSVHSIGVINTMD